MRRFWTRVALAVCLAVATLLPALPGVARATSPAVTTVQCATALSISSRTVASCGEAVGGVGRVGTYDSTQGRISWGPWQTRLQIMVPNRMTVPATDGYTGRFIGFPTVSDRFGSAVIHGTQYRPVTDSGGPTHYVGRRGVYKLGTNLFTPSEGWYRTTGCVPLAPCPEWKHEPGSESS